MLEINYAPKGEGIGAQNAPIPSILGESFDIGSFGGFRTQSLLTSRSVDSPGTVIPTAQPNAPGAFSVPTVDRFKAGISGTGDSLHFRVPTSTFTSLGSVGGFSEAVSSVLAPPYAVGQVKQSVSPAQIPSGFSRFRAAISNWWHTDTVGRGWFAPGRQAQY